MSRTLTEAPDRVFQLADSRLCLLTSHGFGLGPGLRVFAGSGLGVNPGLGLFAGGGLGVNPGLGLFAGGGLGLSFGLSLSMRRRRGRQRLADRPVVPDLPPVSASKQASRSQPSSGSCTIPSQNPSGSSEIQPRASGAIRSITGRRVPVAAQLNAPRLLVLLDSVGDHVQRDPGTVVKVRLDLHVVLARTGRRHLDDHHRPGPFRRHVERRPVLPPLHTEEHGDVRPERPDARQVPVHPAVGDSHRAAERPPAAP